jgi:hypothetical protein
MPATALQQQQLLSAFATASALNIVAAGTGQSPFARLADAVTIGGKFAVLDSRLGQIAVLDTNTATPIDFYGDGAQTDDWLTGAVRLSRQRDRSLVVLDQGGRLRRLTLQGDSLRISRISLLPTTPYDFCALGDTIYSLQRKRGVDASIDVMTWSGDRLRPFGEGYRAINTMVRAEVDRARLECVEERQLVLLALVFVPEVYAYGTDGDVRWIARLDPFVPTAILEDGKSGRVLRGLMEPGFTEAMQLYRTAVVDTFLVMQFRHISIEGLRTNRLYDAVHTFVVDLANGQSAYLGTHHDLIGAATNTAMLTFRDEPEGRVAVGRRVREFKQ